MTLKQRVLALKRRIQGEKIQCYMKTLPGGQHQIWHVYPTLTEGTKCLCGKMENYRDGGCIGHRKVKDNETLPELH